MKLRLLTLLICSVALSAFAEVINPDEALARALFSPKKPLSATNIGSAPKLVKTETAGNLPTVYIFSTESNGYMVLSADDQATPMLAYGTNFTGEINPAMQWLLGEYSKEIESIRNNPQRRLISLTSSTDKAPVAPIVSTRWNQGDPFNQMCPSDDGGRCVTGCVATAMAQVINYHKYPTGNGIGVASYEWNGQTLTFDFANNSFDWGNMVDVYSSTSTQVQKDAVAELMYACGVSVFMGYGSGASGAYSKDVPAALCNHFGFDESVHMDYRKYYTAQEWDDFIYTQLTENGPLYLSGSNEGGGHAFVCDGYSSDGFYHINWGWGGSSDGYFKLSALDPSNQGIGGSTGGYSMGLGVIADLKTPVEGSSYFMEISIHDVLSTTTTSTTLGSDVLVNGGFYNTGNCDLDCDLGFIIENVTTNETTSALSWSSDLQQGYGYQQIYLRIPSTLSNGTYKAYPAWKTSNSDMEWEKMRGDNNNANYVLMVVEGSSVTLSIDQGATIQMQNYELTTPVFMGYDATIEGDLVNTSEQDYYGYVFPALFDTETFENIGRGYFFNVEVRAGATTHIAYTSELMGYQGVDFNPGDYYLAFADQNGNIISNPILITIQDTPEAGTVNVSSFEFVGDTNNADRDNIEFNATINCTDGYFIGTVDLWIFCLEGNGYYSVGSISSPTLYIETGDSVEHTFQGAFPSLNIGDNCFGVIFQGYSDQLTGLKYFTIGQTSGIEDIAVDCEVTSREYFTISGLKVAEENLTPGVYIVIEHMSDGQVKTTKKIVK